MVPPSHISYDNPFENTMNMNFIRKLPIPRDVKQEYPVPENLREVRKANIRQIEDALSGASDKFLIFIGPCSADREDSVMDYLGRLRTVQEKVADKLVIVPRLYTNKPRTTGDGYKGMLHQPDPTGRPDMFRGILTIRELHMRALVETGFSCADEMLYTENHRYVDDLLAYVAIGARSVENQQHRLTASGLDIPVGMKNPTSGDFSVMLNAITAAQHSHTFIYRNWEVESQGNPYAHAILRGYVNKHGQSLPNYHYEDMIRLIKLYSDKDVRNRAVIVDTNHSNSNKQYLEQVRIAKEVLHERSINSDIHKLVKGFMIESYLEDGCQKPEDAHIYGKSITDPCLGWEKTERLLYDIAELV